MELISNRHLYSLSCMKDRYVGSKYMHFMTTNNYMKESETQAVGPHT
jgi:hypothetical protein